MASHMVGAMDPSWLLAPSAAAQPFRQSPSMLPVSEIRAGQQLQQHQHG